MAKIEANVAGADDALMLDQRGFIAETNATHVFIVEGEQKVLELAGWDMVSGLVLSGLWNASWSVLELRDRWRILSYNNVVPEA